MDDLTVVFRSASDIEASVVRGLLESHGIASLLSSSLSQSIFPLAVDGIGDVRISVRPEDAEEAQRIIDSHRTEPPAAALIPLRNEFAVARAAPRLYLPRSRPARARTDAHVARQRGRQRRRHRQRVPRIPRRCGARLRRLPTCCSAGSRARRRLEVEDQGVAGFDRRRSRGSPSGCVSATICCSAAAKRRPAGAANRRCSPTATKR